MVSYDILAPLAIRYVTLLDKQPFDFQDGRVHAPWLSQWWDSAQTELCTGSPEESSSLKSLIRLLYDGCDINGSNEITAIVSTRLGLSTDVVQTLVSVLLLRKQITRIDRCVTVWHADKQTMTNELKAHLKNTQGRRDLIGKLSSSYLQASNNPGEGKLCETLAGLVHKAETLLEKERLHAEKIELEDAREMARKAERERREKEREEEKERREREREAIKNRKLKEKEDERLKREKERERLKEEERVKRECEREEERIRKEKEREEEKERKEKEREEEKERKRIEREVQKKKDDPKTSQWMKAWLSSVGTASSNPRVIASESCESMKVFDILDKGNEEEVRSSVEMWWREDWERVREGIEKASFFINTKSCGVVDVDPTTVCMSQNDGVINHDSLEDLSVPRICVIHDLIEWSRRPYKKCVITKKAPKGLLLGEPLTLDHVCYSRDSDEEWEVKYNAEDVDLEEEEDDGDIEEDEYQFLVGDDTFEDEEGIHQTGIVPTAPQHVSFRSNILGGIYMNGSYMECSRSTCTSISYPPPPPEFNKTPAGRVKRSRVDAPASASACTVKENVTPVIAPDSQPAKKSRIDAYLTPPPRSRQTDVHVPTEIPS